MAIRGWRQSIVISALWLLWGSLHAQPQGTEYEVDSSLSQVYWQVYSAGALSRLGHNHVILAPELMGSVSLDETPSKSSFRLRIPVNTLVVDDPALRATLGEDFSGEPSAEDIESTRRNMLSDRLLDAEQYPMITLAGSGPFGEGGDQKVILSVEIAGNAVELIVPASITVEMPILVAEGSFRLTHEELGLRPFSALLGALKVAQEMDFTYRIVARRVE